MTAHKLTHTIANTMPVYPGTEQPVLTTACTIEETGYRETLLHMYSHTGTHMDAPAHMIEGGTPLDAFPVEAFVGRGFVLDCRGQGEISPELLRQHEEAIRQVDFLLFCTGWDKFWGAGKVFCGFPLSDSGGGGFCGIPPPQRRGGGFHFAGPL